MEAVFSINGRFRFFQMGRLRPETFFQNFQFGKMAWILPIYGRVSVERFSKKLFPVSRMEKCRLVRGPNAAASCRTAVAVPVPCTRVRFLRHMLRMPCVCTRQSRGVPLARVSPFCRYGMYVTMYAAVFFPRLCRYGIRSFRIPFPARGKTVRRVL